MSFLRLTTQIITCLATTTLLIIAALILTTRFALPGGLHIYSVLTQSMDPGIPAGSLIVTKTPASEHHLQPGDIITFSQPGHPHTLVTHRINHLDATGKFVTQGDANPKVDPWLVSYGHIKGMKLLHIPKAGTILEFIKSPTGLLLFVGLPILLIVISEIRSIIHILVNQKVRAILLHLKRTGRLNTKTGPAPTPATQPVKRLSQRPHHHLDSAHSKRNHSTVYFTASFILLTATIYIGSPGTRATFISSTVSITGNSISTAAVFPTPTPTSEDPCHLDVNVDTRNINTGPGSTNINDVDINNDCTHTENNSANTNNETDVTANTGNNSQTDNTQSGDINTGNISISFSTHTSAN